MESQLPHIIAFCHSFLIEHETTEPRNKIQRMGIHILRKDQYNDCSIAFSWAPGGTGKRGRLKTTWRRTVKKEREESGWRSWAEARVAAVEALCATTCTRHEAVR